MALPVDISAYTVCYISEAWVNKIACDGYIGVGFSGINDY